MRDRVAIGVRVRNANGQRVGLAPRVRHAVSVAHRERQRRHDGVGGRERVALCDAERVRDAVRLGVAVRLSGSKRLGDIVATAYRLCRRNALRDNERRLRHGVGLGVGLVERRAQ